MIRNPQNIEAPIVWAFCPIPQKSLLADTAPGQCAFGSGAQACPCNITHSPSTSCEEFADFAVKGQASGV